ncbi:PKD domain-containing protein [bacterium]|nr:PKD domain-containing protein [bacterium]
MRLSAGPLDCSPHIACLLALLLLSGCAGSGVKQHYPGLNAPGAAGLRFEGQSAYPAGDALAGLPSPRKLLRGSSAEAQFEQSGASAIQVSSGAVLNGDELVLDAGSLSQGSEWGIFTLAGPDAVQFISLQVAADVSSDMWLALADTVSNRWIWYGPFDAGTELDLSALSFVSTDPLGAVVLAPAGHSVTVNTLELSTIQPDNNPPNAMLTPAQSAGNAPYEAMLDGGGSDAGGDSGDSIALYEWDFENDGVIDLSGAEVTGATPTYFAPGIHTVLLRVADSRGATAEATATVAVTAFGNNPPAAELMVDVNSGVVPFEVNFDAIGSLDGGDAGDSIVLFEWDFDGDGVYDQSGPDAATTFEYSAARFYHPRVRVSDIAGNQDTDIVLIEALPEIELLDAGNAIGPISIFEVTGNPAVAYAGLNDNTLRFVRANDSLGQDWGAQVIVATSSEGRPGNISAELVAGRPAIVYQELSDVPGQNYKMQYVRALDNDGTLWGSPIEPAVFLSSGHYSLEVIQGKPAIAYWDQSSIGFLRADNAAGSSWGAPVVVTPAPNAAPKDVQLLSVNGRPAVCFIRQEGSPSDAYDIEFHRAMDSTGSSWDSGLLILDDSDGGYTPTQVSMALQAGRPVISYTSRNADQDPDLYSLSFVRSLTDDGDAWSSSVLIVEGEDYLSGVAIGAYGERSYIVLDSSISGGVSQLYSALNSNGTIWPPPLSLASGISFAFTNLREFDGRLHIATATSSNRDLLYLNVAPQP